MKNQQMFDRTMQSPKSAASENILSPQRKRAKKLTVGELKCLFCDLSENNKPENLCAAGTFHAAANKIVEQHVREFTEKIKIMTLFLNDLETYSKLSTGDVASSEIYYHKRCLHTLVNRYNSEKTKECNSSLYIQKEKEELAKELSFNKIVSYIYEKLRENAEAEISFVVSDLEKLYIDLLAFDNIEYTSHVSRFTERLISAIPQLEKRIIKKKAVVVFSDYLNDILPNVLTPNTFLKSVMKTVLPIRNDMKTVQNNFIGNFSQTCQQDSVPIRLLTLISVLIDGTDVNNKGFSQSSLAVAQLIMYNFKLKNVNETSVQRRHLKPRETPGPIYVGLKLYATVRSKFLIDRLFQLGICISYDRVLGITNAIASSMLQKYEEEKFFLPNTLHKSLYTVIAKDNIDLNSSSTMIKQHYHGISMTVMQFPTEINSGLPQQSSYDFSRGSDSPRMKLALPTDYVKLKELPFKTSNPLFSPVCTVNLDNYSMSEFIDIGIRDELCWLESVSQTEGDNCSPWSTFHASANRQSSSNVGLNALLPLINQKVATLQSQFHCMNIIKNTIHCINPAQTPVDVSDQPVYALSKEVQFRYPSFFGPHQYVCVLGDLHIEHTNLLIHGELIKGSGLEVIFETNNLSTKGTSAVVDANHIKRARYCLQISVCVIYKLLKEAHIKSASELNILDWLADASKYSEMCFYWKMIFEVQLGILLFVRSIREGNFKLYLAALYSFLKWYFSFDKYNYARWATIYWFDMASIHITCPDVYNELVKGHFSFLKTNSEFSRMPLDQLHEQNNKHIKGVSGATHLVNRYNDSALVRWELCGAELSRILQEFENGLDVSKEEKARPHHEDNATFQRNFSSDIRKVYGGFSCNPFEMKSLTCISNTEVSFDDHVFYNLSILETTGKTQLNAYIQERLIYGKVSINAKIVKNHFTLLGDVTSKQKRYTLDHRLTPTFLTKLRAAVTYRRYHTKMLFQSEIFGTAQSLCVDEKSLYHGTKADLLKRFEKTTQPILSDKAAIIIELSAVIRFLCNIKVDTFNTFAKAIYKHIKTISADYQRVDIICDRYFKHSLKNQTRSERGSGNSAAFDGLTPFPNDFSTNFLKNSDNKEKLNHFLADQLYSLHNDSSKCLLVTKGKDVVTTDISLRDDQYINQFPSEEADPRLVRHMIHCVRSGHPSIVVRTVDSDVLILLLAFRHFANNFSSTVFCHFGSGDSACYYNINEICLNIGEDVCHSLPFFFAFSGCDTVSAFFNQGKCKLWDRWLCYPNRAEITQVFCELSNMPESVSAAQLDTLCNFLLFVYNPHLRENMEIDYYRMREFECSTHNNLRLLPPSKIGLLEHAKRACFQGGWIWRHCIINTELPDPEHWGWKLVNGQYLPLWQSLAKEVDVDSLIITCACKVAKCQKCLCAKKGMDCIQFCKCQRKCLYQVL